MNETMENQGVITADICVIGGGSGGLTMAAGASQLGMRTVLVEGRKMGGDCLNFGCVPSKAILAAAHAAQAQRNSAAFGVSAVDPVIDFARVRDHVHQVIAAIAPHDSVERFEGLGVTVIQAMAKFIGRDRVEAGGQQIKAKYFVIATGSGPFVPPIAGIDTVPYFTNETIFDNARRPDHLLVIGGGPIGCELAQAHRRLGARVTVIEALSLLPRDDAEAAAIIRDHLQTEGIALREGAKVVTARRAGDQIELELEVGGARETLAGSDLLIAAGRKPHLTQLDLEKAGVAYTKQGITVDARLRTSNKRIYAIGDVAGSLQFTHMAGYHAGIAIRNMLFKLPAKARTSHIPWVTFTDPELAHVGLTEAQAAERHGAIKILRWPYAGNDRAQAERATSGFVKAIVTPKGRILGATIVGAHAGELIHLWSLAISQGLKIGAIANMVAPYPTLGEISKRAAGSFYTEKLFSPRTKRLVKLLSRLG